MVNKQDMSTNSQKTPVQPQQPRKPNETGVISVQGFVRIFDPNSNKVYVEKRA